MIFLLTKAKNWNLNTMKGFIRIMLMEKSKHLATKFDVVSTGKLSLSYHQVVNIEVIKIRD